MAELYEAFVYLWYDALKNMFYLGKHKGSPADRYTHSSTVWESFTKDNIPEGVTRKILAYGTDEEMCLLEHELLKNRKKRCWDKYYNQSLGDPRYVDNSGENHHFYGKKLNEEHKKKMSEAHKGKTFSEEHKQKIGEARKGTTHTEESKKKISEAKKGKTHTEESKKKMSEAKKGKTLSEEHRKKVSEAKKGKTFSEDTKKKMSEAKKGTTHTEESKKKISEAKKGKNNPNSRENRIKRAAENQANSTTLVEFLA